MHKANNLNGTRVLLIDDSNTMRRSGEIFLTRAGCKVFVAEDGFDALGKIADYAPDLIFVDIIMPRLDGYQTCSLIKRHSKYQNIPVIMLSAKDSLFDRALGRKAGANDYLTKPFSKETLTQAAAAHLQFQLAA